MVDDYSSNYDEVTMKSIDKIADEIYREAVAVSEYYKCSMAVAIDEVFYARPEQPTAIMYMVMERSFRGSDYE